MCKVIAPTFAEKEAAGRVPAAFVLRQMLPA
jgi:hypothetical protein